MGYTSKSGKRFNNPAIGRMHDRQAGMAKPEPETPGGGHDGDHADVHAVTHHAPDDPENPSPGKHHTVTRHADGQEEHADHESADEANAHAGEQMGAGGEDPGDHHLGAPELGDPSEEEDTEEPEVCPRCGSEMEGGTCPNCGYSDSDESIQGHEREEEEY